MTTDWILVVGIGVVAVAPVVQRVLSHRFDPFEPIFLFAIAYGTMFVARPAEMLARHELSWFGVDLREELPRALLLALSGAVAFVAGYELRLGSRLAGSLPSPGVIPTRVGLTGAACLVVVAAAATVALFASGGLVAAVKILFAGRSGQLNAAQTATSSYVYLSARLAIPAAYLAFAIALRERKTTVTLGAVLVLAFALLVTVPVGSRSFLLPLLGGGATLYYLRKGKRPSGALIIFAAVAALLLSYLLLNFRDPQSRGEFAHGIARLSTHPTWILDPVLRGPDAEMLPALAAAMQSVPRALPYEYGRATVGDLIVRPIPRRLWSGKPDRERQVIAATVPRLAGYLQPAFSPIFWFYWDFGVYGVLAGMAVLGVLARSLFEWFIRHKNMFSGQLVYAISVWLVAVWLRDDPVDSIVLMTFIVGPIVLISYANGLVRQLRSST